MQINLLHELQNLVLNYSIINLNKNILILKFCKINFCVYITNSLWKCPCHRSSIQKSIQKLLV